jgi:hypothetical protein
VLWNVLDIYTILSLSFRPWWLVIEFVVMLRIVDGWFGVWMIDWLWGRWCKVHFALGSRGRRGWNEMLSAEQEWSCKYLLLL